ncbi:MAG: adenylate/guanylate cyclase domain-containing protein [Bacteroidota bacterium]
MRQDVPKFYGLRIYILTTILYFLLVMPFVMIVGLKSLPQILSNQKGFVLESQNDRTGSAADSLLMTEDTVLQNQQNRRMMKVERDEEKTTMTMDDGGFTPNFLFIFRALLVSFLLGWIFNLPFKRYFNKKRKGKNITPKLYRITKKWILKVPLINAIILGGALFASLGHNFLQLGAAESFDEVSHNIYRQYLYISIIATILVTLLIFFWERHRVHLKYLEHVYTLDELSVPIFKGKRGRIRNRLLVSNLMTSLLPLTIVMLYIFLSVTQLKDLDVDLANSEQVKLLFGTETSLFETADAEEFSYEDLLKYPFMIYVNAWNSMFMFFGIFSGILIATVYLILFVKWTTTGIVRPVNELLEHMQRTGKGKPDEFAIIRTNDEIGALGEGYNYMTRRIKDYIDNISKLNETYFRFVPKQFLEILGKKEIAEIAHGDQIEKEMTVLFTDIRSFTEISESMTPKENFDFINMYLAYMEPVIGKNNGFIDKYIGDSIMALFPYDAQDAINASIEMRIKLAEFNQVITQFDKEPINSGIGIHTGNLMLGIVGGENRLDGTVISDAVNLAARLEGLTKIYGGSVIISEDTLTKLREAGNYEYRFLDVVKVKGKKKAVYIFEILNGEPERCRELKKNTKYDFGRAADMYQNKEFERALDLFKKVYDKNPSDIAALFYIKRCKEIIKHGLPENWDGIERLHKI